MRRRAVLGLGSTLLAAPWKVLAQPSRTNHRLGTFQFSQTAVLRVHMQALRERLGQLGFTEGRNLLIFEEYSAFDAAVRRRSVDSLIRAKPDVILAFGSTNTRLVQEVSAGRIPVVFTIVGDPIAYGIVKNLARPGANTTGVASLQREMTVKRLELLREVLPKAKRVVLAAYLKDISFTASEALVRETAARLGLDLLATTLAGDMPEAAVGKALQGGADAVFVYQPMSFIVGLDVAEKIAQLGLARRIPVFFAESESVARGGLLSYGPDFLDETRRAADLVAKVLKGSNAGELPVDQSSRYELVVNLKTADALGIVLPPSVRPRIDRVIQ